MKKAKPPWGGALPPGGFRGLPRFFPLVLPLASRKPQDRPERKHALRSQSSFWKMEQAPLTPQRASCFPWSLTEPGVFTSIKSLPDSICERPAWEPAEGHSRRCAPSDFLLCQAVPGADGTGRAWPSFSLFLGISSLGHIPRSVIADEGNAGLSRP